MLSANGLALLSASSASVQAVQSERTLEKQFSGVLQENKKPHEVTLNYCTVLNDLNA